MMRPSADVKVHLHREPIDMRRGRNGLAALVREGVQQDPFAAQSLYVIIGHRYDALKILSWDRNGSPYGGRGSRAMRSFTGRVFCRRDHVDRGATELAARWLRCVVGAASNDPMCQCFRGNPAASARSEVNGGIYDVRTSAICRQL
jgi:hypothetical protein